MIKFLVYIFILIFNISGLFSCECYDLSEIREICHFYTKVPSEADKAYLYSISQWQDKDLWELPYVEDLRFVEREQKTVLVDYKRYSSTYLGLSLIEKKINIIANYDYEMPWQRYFGPEAGYWAHTVAEREIKIAEERENLSKRLTKVKNCLENSRDKITTIYQGLYQKCLQKHASITTYYEYGLLASLNNDFEFSLEMLQNLMSEAEKTGQLDVLDSCFYQSLGSSCFEIMAYDKAIEYLSEAIRKDPENKAAYFDRALAYFETGDFDLAHLDYLSSDKGNSDQYDYEPASSEFSDALLASTLQGVKEAAIEFVPSMCSSVYGLGEALWIGLEHPIDSSKKFVSACHAIGANIKDFCKNVDWDDVEGYVDHVKTLYDRFDQLADTEKGELIGHTIGKYGVDIFAGGALIKGASAVRKLKQANRACNLEKLAATNAEKEALITAAKAHAAERDAFFKNVKLHRDSQNKHIPGKHNFLENRSIFEHNDPERLITKFAGKGIKANNSKLEPGYKELVDFKEHIGIWKDEKIGTIPLNTTKGHIHYGKNGKAHIIPAHPDSKGF